MFPLYNNLDKQIQIFAKQKYINQLNKGVKMSNSIVQMPAPGEFDLYHKLDKHNQALFEFSLKNCDRFIHFETIKEIRLFFLEIPVLEEMSLMEIENIISRIKEFGFCYKKTQLTPLAPVQKILFLYSGGKYGN